MKSYFLFGHISKNSQGRAGFDCTFHLQVTTGQSEERPQMLWGSILPSPSLTGAPLLAPAPGGPISACPTFLSLLKSPYFLQNQSSCKSHTPPCHHFPYCTYLLLLFLQNLALFIALSYLHKNSAKLTVDAQEISGEWTNLEEKFIQILSLGIIEKKEAWTFQMCFLPHQKTLSSI